MNLLLRPKPLLLNKRRTYLRLPPHHSPTPPSQCSKTYPFTMSFFASLKNLPGPTVAVQQDVPEMPDTPLPGFEIAEITKAGRDIPETPLPPPGEEDNPPFLQDELFDTVSIETEQQPGTIAMFDVPPISMPAPIAIEIVGAGVEKGGVGTLRSPSLTPAAPPAPSKRLPKWRVALALLVILALCSISLWHDVSDTHLYLYSINPLDGQVQAQQDLGAGYAETATLTNPVLLQSSLLVGLPQQQRILSLSGGGTAWNISRQVSAPLAHATLNVAPNHALVIAYAGGVQVLSPDGKLLWQARGDGPALGAHAFAPAFDDTTLYTVKDASGGVIAAYDLRSGTTRWSQRLDDSFAYAPPFLLYGNTLFAAGDHTIYALDRTGGRLLWKVSAPVRTLLIDSAEQPLLIAAGAAGLQAFDGRSGKVVWSFYGRPAAAGGSASLTGAQFYQAAIPTTNDVVYATGITWNAQQAREQLWLYAVNASSGVMRWSEQISADFASVDAGRVLAPSVEATLGMLLLEVARGDGSHLLAAYNTSDGSLRWSTGLAGVTAFAPDLLQAEKTSINIFSVQADAGTALHNWSWLRLLMLAFSAASILLLLGLWLFPLENWPRRARAGLRAPLRGLRTYFSQIRTSRRYSRRARLLVACCLIALLVGASFLTFLAISRPQQYLNAIDAGSGSTQWQHALDTPSTLSGAGDHESFVVMKTGSALSVLSALNGDGSRLWSTPASEGSYSLPPVQTAPGTLMVALSGPTSLPYVYAPGDPAYTQSLAHLFTLSLLDSATGRVLWQSSLVRAGEAQDTAVLASDAQYTYVASRSIPTSSQTGQAAVVQLIAVDTASGAIAWRLFGAREKGTTPPDFGALLPHGRLLYWQVDGAVYAIDTRLGQIQWRRPLAEDNATAVRLDETQMALSGNVLLVRRSDRYHALDAATGNQLWSASGLGPATALSPGGILATGGRFILYGNGTIEAIDASTQAVLWRHDDLANIPDAVLAADGSLVYAIVFDTQDGSTQRQVLVAFDVKDSSVRWTFQPSGQALFVYPGAPQLHSAHGMLYVTICLLQSASSRCDSQALYGINGATGAVAWKFATGQVSALQVSQHGSTIVFQTSSSPWENFKARFQG